MFLPIVIAIFLGAWGLPPSPSQSPSPTLPVVASQAQKANKPNSYQNQSKPNLASNSSDKKRAGRAKDQKEKTDRWEKLVAKATVWIAAFTVLLFIANILLWWGGEKHSERELRAYVFPTEIKVANFKTDKNLVAYVKIENGGQTPAYKLTCRAKFIAGPFPQTDFTLSKEDFPNPAVEYLAPHGTSWRPARARHHATAGQQEAVTEGTHAIYVFGRIDYTDAFNVTRWTTFRSIARGENGFMNHEEGKKDVLILSFDKEGNDAT